MANKKNITTLYNDDEYTFLYVKEDIASEEGVNLDEVENQRVWDQISFYLQTDWEDFCELINNVDAPYGWLIGGNNRTWRGSGYGIKMVGQNEDITRAIADLGDNTTITTENGHLKVDARHHDGGCFVELKPITSAGYKHYEDWLYGNNTKTTYECYEDMFNCNLFTRLPHLEKVF